MCVCVCVCVCIVTYFCRYDQSSLNRDVCVCVPTCKCMYMCACVYFICELRVSVPVDLNDKERFIP